MASITFEADTAAEVRELAAGYGVGSDAGLLPAIRMFFTEQAVQLAKTHQSIIDTKDIIMSGIDDLKREVAEEVEQGKAKTAALVALTAAVNDLRAKLTSGGLSDADAAAEAAKLDAAQQEGRHRR